MRDLRRLQDDAPPGVSAAPQEDNVMQWEAVIFGPEDTIWENGAFTLKMTFSEEYPVKPPNVVFVTPIFHPNVYASGAICLDILNKQWTPIYDIGSILTSIQSLLTEPNPTSPANAEAARLFVENRREYDRRVVECVERSWRDADATLDDDAKADGEDAETDAAAATADLDAAAASPAAGEAAATEGTNAAAAAGAGEQ